MQVKNGLARLDVCAADAQNKEESYVRNQEAPVSGVLAEIAVGGIFDHTVDVIFAVNRIRLRVWRGNGRGSVSGKKSKEYLGCQAGNFQTVDEEGQ